MSFDSTGTLPANAVVREKLSFFRTTSEEKFATPSDLFWEAGFVLEKFDEGRYTTLVKDVDYRLTYQLPVLRSDAGSKAYGAVLVRFFDKTASYYVSYQALGSSANLNRVNMFNMYSLGAGQVGERLMLVQLDGASVLTQAYLSSSSNWVANVRVPQSASVVSSEAAVQSKAVVSAITTQLSNPLLAAWAANLDALIVGTVTRDANGAALSANVAWPDGATGMYTATSLSSAFPGSVDAYSITHVYQGVTSVIGQPAVTRDASGVVTVKPALTVA